MITIHIRKQGRAAIITIPSDVLKMLNIGVGATLELDVTQKEFIARPVRDSKRKHYTLTELLQGTSTTPRNMKLLNKETEWARSGKPQGRELA